MATICVLLIACCLVLVFYFISHIRKDLHNYHLLLEEQQHGFSREEEIKRYKSEFFHSATLIVFFVGLIFFFSLIVSHA